MAGQPANPLSAAIRECRVGLAWLALFSFLINILVLTSPIYMMQVYDRVLSSAKLETLVMITLMAGVAVLILGLLEMTRNKLLVRIGCWLERKLAPELITAGMRVTIAGGQVGAQALRDLVQVRSFIGGAGINTIFDAPWTPIFLAVIWLMHPVLGLVGLGSAIVLLGIAVLNEYVGRKSLKQAGSLSISAMHKADQAIRNADAFLAMGMLPAFLHNWNERNGKALALQIKAANANAWLVGLSKFVRIYVQILILGTGAYLVIKGDLTSGGMIAASILLGRALAPVEQAIGAWKGMVSARDAYGRLKTLLDKAPPMPEGMPLPAPSGRLTCEGIIYVPRGRDKPVLNGVTFALAPGEAMGVIGPSAAGKSTLCKILVGSWQPTRGHARLDGADLFSWSSDQLGPYVGYLPQDVELFGGTVKDNIARLAPDADPESVVEAAKTAGVHEIILRLPNGYDTDIGEGGSFLSGGQRQRIGLARALYGRPRLIVLDEPNASLDTEGEDSLITAMETAKSWGATVVLVAHQPRILKPVGKLLLLRDGRSELFGPRDEVLAKLKPSIRPASTGSAAGAAPGSTAGRSVVSPAAPPNAQRATVTTSGSTGGGSTGGVPGKTASTEVSRSANVVAARSSTAGADTQATGSQSTGTQVSGARAPASGRAPGSHGDGAAHPSSEGAVAPATEGRDR